MTHPIVLVIDDDPDFLEGLRISFEHSAFFVTTATNGAEGLQKAIQLRPDCIILDILMPKQDGDAVFKALKNHPETASVPVIVLTSLLPFEGHVGAHSLMRDSRIAAYYEKPVDPKQLIDKVKMLISAEKPASH